MEERLLEAHRSGRVRTTMGRSSDYYGPRGTVAGDRVFRAAVEGKTARWLGSLDRPHTLNYLPDMARALVTLGEREEADGEAWHLPAAEPITGRRFLGMVFAEAGGSARIGVVSKTAVRLGSVFVPFVREVRETMYQFERPFDSDASKFLGTFGPFEPTPHGEAVARSVAWFRERRGSVTRALLGGGGDRGALQGVHLRADPHGREKFKGRSVEALFTEVRGTGILRSSPGFRGSYREPDKYDDEDRPRPDGHQANPQRRDVASCVSIEWC
jgi:hypothetical protein